MASTMMPMMATLTETSTIVKARLRRARAGRWSESIFICGTERICSREIIGGPPRRFSRCSEPLGQLGLAGGEDFLMQRSPVRVHCDHGGEPFDFQFPDR